MESAGQWMIASYEKLEGTGHPQEKVMASAAHLAQHLSEVPAIVIPTIIGVHDGSGRPGLFDSVIQSTWSFCVALRARGLGSAWTTAILSRRDDLAELLGIPEGMTQIAMLPVAWMKGTDVRLAPRRPARRSPTSIALRQPGRRGPKSITPSKMAPESSSNRTSRHRQHRYGSLSAISISEPTTVQNLLAHAGTTPMRKSPSAHRSPGLINTKQLANGMCRVLSVHTRQSDRLDGLHLTPTTPGPNGFLTSNELQAQLASDSL